MNDLLVVALPTWAFWFLVTIGVLNTIDLTLKIVNHFLAKRVKQVCQNSELAPNRKPAKQDGALTNEGTKGTAQCWKCGDSDPAFTDVCQAPACGMREGT